MADKVFINGRAAIHKGSAGKSMAFPDVCLCPPAPPSGPIPTPLTNTAKAGDLQGGAATVTIEGNPVAHAKSYIAKSTGNEVARSTGGGVITHQVQGAAYFQTFSMNVFIESQPAVRHLDLLTHNHMARMPGNTPPAPWMSAMTAGAGTAPAKVEKDAREGKDWLELELVDLEGEPIAHEDCTLETPAGKTIKSRGLLGGAYRFVRLAKGTCRISFPRWDSGSASAARQPQDKIPSAEADRGKRSQADKLYVPGRVLSLATGKKYRIELPRGPSFVLELAARHREAKVQPCAYVLRSKDGKYEVRRTLADDLTRDVGAVVLCFPDLRSDALYSLTHEPEQGMARQLFRDVPYEELRGRAKALKTKRPKNKVPVDDVPDELRRLHEAELARGRDRQDETFPGLEEPE